MDVRVFWNAGDWVEAVAELPARGPLPCRVVLVPRERVAHVLRRELIRTDRGYVLAGTRFITCPVAAVEVLRIAGVAFEPGEEALRVARLLALFRAGLPLGHFPLDLLRSKPGWDEAFGCAISDLEGTGLRSEDLATPDALARLRDVATSWRALDDSAGPSWTTQRILLEAAVTLERRPDVWPFQGAVLGFAGGDVTGAEARFLRAIPGVTLGLLAARPTRERYLDRMETLLGRAAGEALRSAQAPRASHTERDLLASYLFEPPAVLADPARPRSAGPDGTVDLEEHAGVEAEIEVTADWVARQVADGVPLEEVAVLVPTLDPLAGLLAQRLGRLPWPDGCLPVHVAGGLPLASFVAGARALTVVRALRGHLAAEVLGEVLPALRSAVPDGRHLSHGAAMDLVWSLGTVGGNPARPEGALEWASRLAERERDLADQLAQAGAAEGAEESGPARKARDLERLLADLRGVRPAVEGLVGVAQQVVDGAPLTILWPAIRIFFEEWLLQPGEGPRVHVLLEERLGGIASEPTCSSLAGEDGLRLVEETILAARVPVGRFGEPAVYVGTVRQAVGLRFRAVRVIGLAEGHLPSVPREDPVLPDVVRDRLQIQGAEAASVTPPTAADRALDELQALDIVIRNTERRVALSAPRLDIERSQREPSAVILEAAAALGRPNRATGEASPPIPDLVALRRDTFAPAREAAGEFRLRTPLSEAAWQDGVALGALGVPPRWRDLLALNLDRLALLLGGEAAGPLDGLVGPAGADVPVPGLAADRPISPSTLQTLLDCPYAFLLATLLGFEEPASPPSRREIGQPAYGELFHRVAAEFYRRHGAVFCAREASLAEWLARGDAIVDQAFDEFLKQYPLVGEAVRAQQKERLRRDVRALIAYDWDSGEDRRVVAVERGFGRPRPVEIPVSGRSLFLRGRIDRVEVEAGRALVRDLKTGRAHLRIGRAVAPEPTLDLQIGVYGLVAQVLADAWGIPRRVAAAYAYVGRGDVAERSYRHDFHEALEPAARQWLAVAAGLLAERQFPRTPNREDCTYCCFRPVCGDTAQDRAARVLAGGGDILAQFGAIKGAESAEEEA